MGGNPEIRTDLWDGKSYQGDPEDAKKLIWILAMWTKRQRETSVEFRELIQVLGLEENLQLLLDQRGTSVDGTAFDTNEPL